MKFDLSTFIFKKLGINESASIALEAIIYSIILLFFLIIIWIVGRKILTVLFVKVSKLTKTKFDDLLIKIKFRLLWLTSRQFFYRFVYSPLF